MTSVFRLKFCDKMWFVWFYRHPVWLSSKYMRLVFSWGCTIQRKWSVYTQKERMHVRTMLTRINYIRRLHTRHCAPNEMMFMQIMPMVMLESYLIEEKYIRKWRFLWWLWSSYFHLDESQRKWRGKNGIPFNETL